MQNRSQFNVKRSVHYHNKEMVAIYILILPNNTRNMYLVNKNINNIRIYDKCEVKTNAKIKFTRKYL